MKQRLVWIPVRRPRAATVPQTDASNCVISATTTRKPRYGYCDDYEYPSYYGGYPGYYYGGYPWYYYGRYIEQRYPYA